MKTLLAVLLLLFVATESSYGQFYPTRYRPAGLEWQELKTDYFRIIYPAEHAGAAFRSAAILEREYPKVRDLVGGKLQNFPVILNSENDLSNGFVTPLNFRTEIEIPPPKGKSLNPRNSSWLELVLSHELVHASHYNVTNNSLTNLLGIFSPDLRRSVHSAVPLGVFEGLAVEYESHGTGSETGRGNYPWFTQQFTSNVDSNNPWSMGQLIHISARTRPYSRHYIGGYSFTHWLQNRYGDDAMKTAISRHFSWPIFGFGFALRRTTGYWPDTLYRQFQEDVEASAIGPEPSPRTINARGGNIQPLPVPHEGPELRRPLWLNEETLLLHGQFYNATTGFYRYNVTEEKMELLFESRTVEDYLYRYSRDENALYYADYRASLLYENTFTSDLYRYDLNENSKERLTNGRRLFAPSPGSPFFALQTDGYRNLLVSVNSETGSVDPVTGLPQLYSVKEVNRHPAIEGLVAVIMSTGNQQALWVGGTANLQEVLAGDPVLSFENGSIFDVSWHPTERKLLFSGDHTGVLNIYEYDTEGRTIRQITDSAHNAFEGSYSPDGSRIAFIYQDNGLFLPAIITSGNNTARAYLPTAHPLADSDSPALPAADNSASQARPAADDSASPSQISDEAGSRDFADTESATPLLNDTDSQPENLFEGPFVQQAYSPGINWLKPRLLLPFIEPFADNKYEYGVVMAGTDPLGSRSYSLSLTAMHERAWFDLNYTSKQFFPGFSVNLFNQPLPVTLRNDLRPDDQTRFLVQERGGKLDIPIPLTLEQNTRLTSIEFIPGYKISQRRFYRIEEAGSALSDYETRQTALLAMNVNLKIRQYRRDMQPNAGLRLFARAETDIVGSRFRFIHRNQLFFSRSEKRRGLYGGLVAYMAPLARWNQSLGLGARIITQSRASIYDTDNLGFELFSSPVFPNANNLISLDTRYTLPLFYSDDGGVTIPAYLDTIYGVLYSQSIGDLNQGSFSDILSASRTAFGAGIRMKMRLSNLALDLGIGFSYEPTRDQWKLVVGQF